jgi:hypothetical protein
LSTISQMSSGPCTANSAAYGAAPSTRRSASSAEPMMNRLARNGCLNPVSTFSRATLRVCASVDKVLEPCSWTRSWSLPPTEIRSPTPTCTVPLIRASLTNVPLVDEMSASQTLSPSAQILTCSQLTRPSGTTRSFVGPRPIANGRAPMETACGTTP